MRFRYQQIMIIPILLISAGLHACKAKHVYHDTSSLDGAGGECLPAKSEKNGVPTRDAIVHQAKVSDHEIEAINKYTSDTYNASMYRDILQCSRDSRADFCLLFPSIVKDADLFASGIKKISETVPFVGDVYRGILISTKEIEKLKGLTGKTVGLAYEGKEAYTSSTRSIEFAKSWLDTLHQKKSKPSLDGPSEPQTKVLYKIKQCRGASIESIEPKGRAELQREVILPPTAYEYRSSSIQAGMLVLDLVEPGCTNFGLMSDGDGNSDEALESEVLRYIDLSEESPAAGLSLAQNCASRVEYDRSAKEKGKKIANDVLGAVDAVRQAEMAAINAPRDQVGSLREVVLQKQVMAKRAASSFKSALELMRFSPGRIIPIAGAAAEVIGLAMGIEEAVNIKKGGGSDAAAAAAVLGGWGLAGAIPAVIACEDCTPDEKAAAFFSGALGIDFTHLVVCPGKRCPHDKDLVQSYLGPDGSRDWSLRRIKRSCSDGYPIIGTAHAETQLNISCGTKNLAAQGIERYNYIENSYQEQRWNYDLSCGEGEYLAGISFGVTTHYGIKSILCASPKKSTIKLGGQCRRIEDAEACAADQFMRGIHVSRAYRNKGLMGVFVDRTNRDDDLREYGDHVKSVVCCSYK